LKNADLIRRRFREADPHPLVLYGQKVIELLKAVPLFTTGNLQRGNIPTTPSPGRWARKANHSLSVTQKKHFIFGPISPSAKLANLNQKKLKSAPSSARRAFRPGSY
jgi:hypothetical protein